MKHRIGPTVDYELPEVTIYWTTGINMHGKYYTFKAPYKAVYQIVEVLISEAYNWGGEVHGYAYDGTTELFEFNSEEGVSFRRKLDKWLLDNHSKTLFPERDAIIDHPFLKEGLTP